MKWLALVALALCGACQVEIRDGIYACTEDRDCPDGLRCAGDRCFREPDSGAMDTGPADVSPDTAVVTDADAGDAGAITRAIGIVHSPIGLHQPARGRAGAFRGAELTANGLRLYYAHATDSPEPMYVAERPTLADPFAAPEEIPGTAAASLSFQTLSVSPDELEIFAEVDRGTEGSAIYRARRATATGAFGPFDQVAVTDDPTNAETSPSVSRTGLELYWIQHGGGTTRIRRATRAAVSDDFTDAEDVVTEAAPRWLRLWADDTTLVYGQTSTMMVRRADPTAPWGAPVPWAWEPAGYDGELHYYVEAANEVWFTSRGTHAETPIPGALVRAQVCPPTGCPTPPEVFCDAADLRTPNGLRCFHQTTAAAGFDAARTACQAWDPSVGDFAASVHLRAEVELLVANAFTGWLGLIRPTGGGFRWESGDPLVSTFWGTGEPGTGSTQNCTRQNATPDWSAVACGAAERAICARQIWPSFVP